MNDDADDIDDVKYWIFGSVGLIFFVYATVIIYLVWPLSELGLEQTGVFGDSFGALTALFSGLAFAGLIVTMIMQRQELALQRKELGENRKEFAKSADAQDRNAKLVALTTMLNEYSSEIDKLTKKMETVSALRAHTNKAVEAKRYLDLLRHKKDKALLLIEGILRESGIEMMPEEADG